MSFNRLPEQQASRTSTRQCLTCLRTVPWSRSHVIQEWLVPYLSMRIPTYVGTRRPPPRLPPRQTLALTRVHIGMALEAALCVSEEIALRIPPLEWQLILAVSVEDYESDARREVPNVVAGIRAAGEDVGLGHPVPSLPFGGIDGNTRNAEFITALENRRGFLVIDLDHTPERLQPLADLVHGTPPFFFPVATAEKFR